MKKNSFITSMLTFALFFILFVCSCSKDKTPTLSDSNCQDTVSFNSVVLPILEQNCFGCHAAGNSTGYVFFNYTSVKNQSTAILGAMQGQGYLQMPDNLDPLPDSTIQLVKCWINQGLLNN